VEGTKKELFLKKEFLEVWKMGQGFWENGCTGPPFFEACPAPTLGSANSFKIHGEWRFHFFLEKIILNLEHTWTFMSTVGIFVSSKSEFTKNPTRIASIMEIFCTPLQCRVDLSMFHSFSTSKIWHTST
jgi:hypothetical protein